MDSEVREKSLCSVDVHMLPCKIACYLLHSAIGCITKFSNIFLVSSGLTPAEAGFISGCCFAISAVAGPCWGLLADKTGYRKLIFFILCISLASSGFSWPFIAREFKHPTGYRTWTLVNKSAGLNATEGARFTGDVGCVLTKKRSEFRDVFFNSSSDCKVEVKPFSSSLFYAMFSISAITYVCLYPTEGLLNSIISNILQTSGTTQSYGKQRMFGGLGLGSTNFIAGFAADNFRHPSLSMYTAVYIVFLPFMLLLLPLSFLLFKRTSWERKPKPGSSIESAPQESESLSLKVDPDTEKGGVDESLVEETEENDGKGRSRMKIIMEIFSNFDNVLIILTVLIVGVIRTVTSSFLYLLIKDEATGSRTSMGLSMLTNSLSSFVMFPFTKTIIKKLGGPINCVEISLVAWILRLVLNSYIKNAWLMCLPQLLQCICFALFWAAMIEYIGDISTKEVYITLFSLLTALQYGGGGFLGNLIGGAVYNAYSGPVLCRYTALVGAAWLVLMVFYFHVLGWLKTKMKSRPKHGKDEGTRTMI